MSAATNITESLIEAYDNYLVLLEKGYSELNAFAYVHGIRIPQEDIDAGTECRKRIEDLKMNYHLNGN